MKTSACYDNAQCQGLRRKADQRTSRKNQFWRYKFSFILMNTTTQFGENAFHKCISNHLYRNTGLEDMSGDYLVQPRSLRQGEHTLAASANICLRFSFKKPTCTSYKDFKVSLFVQWKKSLDFFSKSFSLDMRPISFFLPQHWLHSQQTTVRLFTEKI